MTAFDRAWNVVKMARQRVGPVEIWDINEPNLSGRNEEDHEKLAEMGISPTRDTGPEPEWHRRYRTGTRWEGDEPPKNPRGEDDWDERVRHKTNYVPMGGSPWFGDMAVKVRMTPTEFLSLNVPPKIRSFTRGNEVIPERILESPLDWFDRVEDFSGVGRMAQAMKEGYPIFIPNIDIRRRPREGHEDADFTVVGHEGRHRMAAIHDLLGDVPVPVQISSDEFGEGTWNFEGDEAEWQNTRGGKARPSPAMIEALTGAVLSGRENPDARVTIREFEDEMWD